MLTINRFLCFRLHTAGVIVGWIGGVTAFLRLIFISIFIARIDSVVKAIIDKEPNNNNLDPSSLKTTLLIVFSAYLFSNAIHCMASILLVAGTMKERHLMIVPWLINYGVSLFFDLIVFIILLFALFEATVPFGSVLGFILLYGVALAFEYLIFTAIYSLFKKIQSSAEQQRLIPNQTDKGLPSYTRISDGC